MAPPWDEPSHRRPGSPEVEAKLRSGIRRLGVKIHVADEALDAFEGHVLDSMAKDVMFDPEYCTDEELVALSRVTNLNTSSRSDNVQRMTSLVIDGLETAVFRANPYFDDLELTTFEQWADAFSAAVISTEGSTGGQGCTPKPKPRWELHGQWD